ncbi:MAG: TVP38/TMEM64 family protein [Puniceicoccales bacterium]
MNPQSKLRTYLLLAGICILGVLLILWAVDFPLDVSITNILHDAGSVLAQVPSWAYCLIIAFLCALPIPSSPFFIAAGGAYDLPEAILATTIGLVGNLIVSYFLASVPMRNTVDSLLKRREIRFPQPKDLAPWELIVIVRFMPALPMVIQSYILGLSKSPFFLYLTISWPIVSIGAVGLNLAGRGIFDQKLGLLILACGWVLSIGIIWRWIFRKVKKRSKTPPTGTFTEHE